MNRAEIQRLLETQDKISVSRVDEGLTGSRLSARNLEALRKGDYEKMMKKPARTMRRK